jgi:hypothetical protein
MFYCGGKLIKTFAVYDFFLKDTADQKLGALTKDIASRLLV